METMVNGSGRPRRGRVGVALSLTELVAADSRTDSATARRLTLDPPNPDGAWPSLANALAQLAEESGNTGRLVIALMPPLTEVRRLELPPLKAAELQQLLSRNAARYFLSAREPQYVGTSITNGKSSGPVIGAAASARLVKTIYESAESAGWTVDGVVPAEVSWQSAATFMWPDLSRATTHLIVFRGDRTHLLRLEDGSLAGVRRFGSGEVEGELITSALVESRTNGTPPRAGLLGPSEQRSLLSRATRRDVAVLEEPPAEWRRQADDPMLVAATFATADRGLTLRTESAAEVRVAKGRRTTATLLVATVAMLLVSAVFQLWGVKRQLAAVNHERAALRPQLRSTLDSRSNLDAGARKLAMLFAAQRQSPQLSGVIGAVTDALPEDAYLLSFRTRRDTLVVDGLAKNAAGAFDALSAVPQLANVRSSGGVQRQLQDDGTALEHFTIEAQMLLPQPAPEKRR